MSLTKLRASWNLPVAGSVAEAEEAIRLHTEKVRALPGLSRHAPLHYISDAWGGHPAWWRGEDLFFESQDAFITATEMANWREAWSKDFTGLVAGPRYHAFTVEEEFNLPASPQSEGSGPGIALSGIWQVPAALTPEQVDPIYFDVHVPNVRRLPRLRRHTVMKSFNWSEGHHSRAWRSAEVRFDTRVDFDTVFASPDYEVVRRDGFNASVAGPDVDIYAIVGEWLA